jgi:phage shock protein PspC (stress-responsive transcriptional regulator)
MKNFLAAVVLSLGFGAFGSGIIVYTIQPAIADMAPASEVLSEEGAQ